MYRHVLGDVNQVVCADAQTAAYLHTDHHHNHQKPYLILRSVCNFDPMCVRSLETDSCVSTDRPRGFRGCARLESATPGRVCHAHDPSAGVRQIVVVACDQIPCNRRADDIHATPERTVK